MAWVIGFQVWWVDVAGVLCGGLRGWFWLCLGVVVLISGFRVVCVFGRGCSSSLRRRMVLVWVVDVQLLLLVSAASLRSVVLVAWFLGCWWFGCYFMVWFGGLLLAIWVWLGVCLMLQISWMVYFLFCLCFGVFNLGCCDFRWFAGMLSCGGFGDFRWFAIAFVGGVVII